VDVKRKRSKLGHAPNTYYNARKPWVGWFTRETNEHRTKWLAFLLRIREIPASNLSPETDYPDRDFSWFSSVPPEKCRDSNLKLGTTASFRILSKSLIISFDAMQFKLLKASLNKPQNK
jgi:hypothetical protein